MATKEGVVGFLIQRVEGARTVGTRYTVHVKTSTRNDLGGHDQGHDTPDRHGEARNFSLSLSTSPRLQFGILILRTRILHPGA